MEDLNSIKAKFYLNSAMLLGIICVPQYLDELVACGEDPALLTELKDVLMKMSLEKR